MIRLLTAVLLLCSTVACAATTERDHHDARASDRVERLIEQMTVKEKAGQMTQLNISVIIDGEELPGQPYTINEDKLRTIVADYGVGSLFGVWHGALTLERWRDVVQRIQDVALEETRLAIPVVFADDSVHGANYMLDATILPHNLNVAATWDPSIALRAGEITAIETRAKATHWTFAPVCDVARAPAWSRVFETFGEDPYLAAVMSTEMIKGLQGDDLTSDARVAATGKHFLGYSDPKSGRDRTPVYMGETQLRDTHLPPFESAIDHGVATLMINSGEINGVPVHADERLLQDMLRDELGFEGVAVTDWADVNKLVEVHKVAKDKKEAAAMAIRAGIDMSMVAQSTDFADNVVELVESGELEEWRLDNAVRRILTLKENLGLFENPMGGDDSIPLVGSDEHHAASRKAAEDSLVLLRNTDAVLPFAEGSKILVAGPTAHILPPLYGAWSYSWQGTEEAWYPDTPTVIDAMQARFGAANVRHVPTSWETGVTNLDAFTRGCASADAVVLCLGEMPSTERPGDIPDLRLDQAQLDLAVAAIESGTPVVAVMVTNRARTISAIEAGLDAVLWAGHPGPHGADAIAAVLAGDVNPSGHLPFTYPRSSGEIVLNDRKASEDIGGFFEPLGHNPLFAFGDGLSYTAFDYSNMSVRVRGDRVDVSVRVTNSGDLDGADVVQLYVSDLVASVTPHAQRLRAFDKIDLAPGEWETVRFSLSKNDLTLIDRDGNRVFEPGEFRFRIGDLEETIAIQ